MTVVACVGKKRQEGDKIVIFCVGDPATGMRDSVSRRVVCLRAEECNNQMTPYRKGLVEAGQYPEVGLVRRTDKFGPYLDVTKCGNDLFDRSVVFERVPPWMRGTRT